MDDDAKLLPLLAAGLFRRQATCVVEGVGGQSTPSRKPLKFVPRHRIRRASARCSTMAHTWTTEWLGVDVPVRARARSSPGSNTVAVVTKAIPPLYAKARQGVMWVLCSLNREN